MYGFSLCIARGSIERITVDHIVPRTLLTRHSSNAFQPRLCGGSRPFKIFNRSRIIHFTLRCVTSSFARKPQYFLTSRTVRPAPPLCRGVRGYLEHDDSFLLQVAEHKSVHIFTSVIHGSHQWQVTSFTPRFMYEPNDLHSSRSTTDMAPQFCPALTEPSRSQPSLCHHGHAQLVDHPVPIPFLLPGRALR